MAAAVQGVLQLYDLCQPSSDGTILKTKLEGVLHQNIGQAAMVASVLKSMSEAGAGDSERLDFLTCWQGLDRLSAQAASSGSKGDIISGYRKFRDGVLAASVFAGSQGHIPSSSLLDLLSGIRESSDNEAYWVTVVDSIRSEGSWTLLEVAEAVCSWIRECVKDPSSPSPPNSSKSLGSSLPVPRTARGDEDAPSRSTSMNDPGGLLGDYCGHVDSDDGPRMRSRTRGSLMGSCLSDHPDGRSGSGSPQMDLQRAGELVELILRDCDRHPDAAHQSATRLQRLLDKLGAAFQRLEDQVCDLQNVNDSLNQRKDQMEAELHGAHELGDEAHKAALERDDALRSIAILESEVAEWKEHFEAISQDHARLKAKHEETERNRLDTQRRGLQWRDRCEQLTQQAESAEGQADFLRGEIHRAKTQLLEAESSVEEVARLREELEEAKRSLRSYAAMIAEESECSRTLRAQLEEALTNAGNNEKSEKAPSEGGSSAHRASPSRGLDLRRSSVQPSAVAAALASASASGRKASVLNEKPADVMLLEKQLQSQQAELQRLREARDSLLNAWESHEKFRGFQEDEELSPEHIKVQYQSRFQEAQIQALLKHCHELESLLDNTRDAQLGPASGCPDSRRRMSIKCVQEEGMVVFNEMSEQLYTLQVQKADADQELRRLATRVQEQDEQLRIAIKTRDELLTSMKSRGLPQEFFIGNDHEGIPDLAATSETRSCGSAGTPLSGTDMEGFLARCSGRLQPSPKVRVLPRQPPRVSKVSINGLEGRGHVPAPSSGKKS